MAMAGRSRGVGRRNAAASLLLAAALPRPCLSEPVLTLTHPSDGTVLYYGDGPQLNASLRYSFSLDAHPDAAHGLRICVEVQRALSDAGPLDLTWFAEGCFGIEQPLTLILPSAPATFLVQAALADGSVPLAHARSTFELAPRPLFEASYEWSAVPAGASVPTGLEVKMALDGSGSVARIPDPFRLQLSLASHLGIFRGDVFRASTIADIITMLDEHAYHRLRLHPELGRRSCASLALSVESVDGSDRELALPLEMTAEECKLFVHQSRLRVSWEPCEDKSAWQPAVAG